MHIWSARTAFPHLLPPSGASSAIRRWITTGTQVTKSRLCCTSGRRLRSHPRLHEHSPSRGLYMQTVSKFLMHALTKRAKVMPSGWPGNATCIDLQALTY